MIMLLKDVPISYFVIDELSDLITCPTYFKHFSEWIVIEKQLDSTTVKRFNNKVNFADYLRDIYLFNRSECVDIIKKPLYPSKKYYCYIQYL